MVQMCVASEHLPIEIASVHFEVFGETGGFACPVVAGESGEGERKRGRTGADGGGGAWGARGGGGSVIGGGDVCVGWKQGGVVDFGKYPLLHEVNVLCGWNLDGLLGFVEPCVCIAMLCSARCGTERVVKSCERTRQRPL